MRYRRRLFLVAVLAACGWFTAQVASPLPAQQKSGTPAASKDQNGTLNVRYANAYLKLVEAELRKLQDTNRKLPGTIRPSVIEAMEAAVGEARDRLNAAQKQQSDMEGGLYLLAAQSELKAAQESLGKAEAANREVPDTVGRFEVARLQAALELAQVKLEKARILDADSPLAQVQWEIEQLREQVQDLRLIVALLRDRN
ncbi:MAG: hypothetical protein HYX69_18825 [Planctomycetia bacterium]|nr:hypothetical protein [Planctomycetia bacterium]